ncbi:hypothetical protein DXG03_005041 [Asterophora parasitica]|uniref:Holocytochrome c-type synthase n=1 Tax=Asterophora parasitica TaxID=117018 RepID=A0A9P7G8K9_9AGAR|nr:hypothetical protein DXG03_005041 [Asterophora parasitica]
MSSGGCPVDHSSSASAAPSPAEVCPVNHKSNSTSSSTWSRFLSGSQTSSKGTLSTERETSSIPRPAEGNWVYPSEAQFFAAMARKNHNPQAADMKTIVPIHNAVNERAWAEVLKWEIGRGGEACGGVKLVNFQGKPNEKSPKARWKMLLGHDWVVDRCGTRTRYIIDFYTGHSQGAPGGDLSFYLDVRPALDNWEGVKMRVEHMFGLRPSPPSSSNSAKS